MCNKIKATCKKVLVALSDLFFRLFNLVTLQIGDKFVHRNKSKSIMPFLFKIIGFAGIGAITYLLFYVMEKIIFLKPTSAMILFIIFISQIFTLVANIMELTESLYGSKDNAILLSLPAKHSEFFISKLIVFYLLELYNNILFLLPILFGFGIYTGQAFSYYGFALLISITLPLVSILLGAFISIPLSLIKKLLRKVSVLYVFIFAAILAVLFYYSVQLINSIPKPLRFIALYDNIVRLIVNYIDSVNSYALFFKWFNNVLFNLQVGRNLLYIFALIVGLIIVNALTSWPLFFKLSSNNKENAVIKKHKGKNKESKTIFGAFYKKELMISLRTFGTLVANYAMVVFMPLFLYLINGLFNSFDISSFGYNIIFGFNIMVGLLILVSCNTASANALSEEGSEFILLKTSPVDTKLIAWAKILNNAIISFVAIVISVTIMGFLKVFNTKDLVLISISYIFVDFGHILWSFQLDLRNPQIKDVALTGKISNKTNATKSLTIGVVFSVLFGAIAIIMAYVSLIWLYVILCIVFMAWRWLVFDGNLKSYFYDIEL